MQRCLVSHGHTYTRVEAQEHTRQEVKGSMGPVSHGSVRHETLGGNLTIRVQPYNYVAFALA
jgi:hypothetical protein